MCGLHHSPSGWCWSRSIAALVGVIVFLGRGYLICEKDSEYGPALP